MKENMVMASQILAMTKDEAGDPDDLKNFAMFCAKASDDQLPNIYKKEKDAARLEYAEVAKAEMKKRGLGEASDQENAKVVALIAKDFPGADDWDVDGEQVTILDKAGKNIGQISADKLTNYWNKAEERMNKAKELLDLIVEKVTFQDIEGMEAKSGGFGYLGHENRNHATDLQLAQAAQDLGLSYDDVFLWADSRSARHFMDGAPAGASNFANQIKKDLPTLKKEVGQ